MLQIAKHTLSYSLGGVFHQKIYEKNRVLQQKNHHSPTHTMFYGDFFVPHCPDIGVGHTRCPPRPSKRTTISIVTGVSHYHVLQH